MSAQLTISRSDLDACLSALRRAEGYARFGNVLGGPVAGGIISAWRTMLPICAAPVCSTRGCGMPVFGTEGYCASCGGQNDRERDTDDEDPRIDLSHIDADLRAEQVPF